MRVIQKKESKSAAHLKIAENNPNILNEVMLTNPKQKVQKSKRKAPKRSHHQKRLKTNERVRNPKTEVKKIDEEILLLGILVIKEK